MLTTWTKAGKGLEARENVGPALIKPWPTEAAGVMGLLQGQGEETLPSTLRPSLGVWAPLTSVPLGQVVVSSTDHPTLTPV